MGSRQAAPLILSGTNSLFLQNPSSGMGDPLTITGTASGTFTIDPVTRRTCVAHQLIVRFKSQDTDGPPVSDKKISLAHQKIGAKVKKDFTSRLFRAPGCHWQTGLIFTLRLRNTSQIRMSCMQSRIISSRYHRIRPVPLFRMAMLYRSFQQHPTIPFLRTSGGSEYRQTGGTPGADINATSAWDLSTGSNQVIVAVVDTGALYTHTDLSANIWTNPGEIPGNGIDDDHNGYTDDVHGWNFITNTSSPLDDNGHGTHVSGTIGAVGNNSIGVTGVNWQVKIMALKFLDATETGSTSNAISAILYANANGASSHKQFLEWNVADPALEAAIDASPAVVVLRSGK